MIKKQITKKEIIYLIRQFYRIQEHRIAFGGQIRALEEQGFDTNPLTNYFEQLHNIEKDMIKFLKGSVDKEPIWTDFLLKVRGIGPILGSGLINLIDIEKARHVSSLWAFAGLDVVNGKGRSRIKEHLVERKIKGRDGKMKKVNSLSYNPLMKILCWKIGKAFLMSKSPYRKIYDDRKEYEVKKYPELRKFHIDRRAKRYMVKMFLKDLWLFWRDLEGLEVSMPYVIEKQGHKYNPKLDIKP